MSKEFDQAIENLPTYFVNPQDGNTYALGNCLEELVEEAYDNGYIVTGYVSEKLRRKNELDLRPIDSTSFLSDRIKLIQDPEKGIVVEGSNSYKLKSIFVNNKDVSDNELTTFFANQVKEYEKVARKIGLKEGISFGEFIEGYFYRGFFMDIEDTEAADSFFDDMQPFIMEFDFYFAMERHMRKIGLLEDNELISPITYYSQMSQRLAIAKDSQDIHFNEYEEFVQLDSSANFLKLTN